MVACTDARLGSQDVDMTKRRHKEGKEEETSSKSKRAKRAKRLLDDPEKLISKLIKWSKRGTTAKLSDVLDQCGDGAEALTRVKDAEGRTLLHHACAAGHLDVVKLLLRHGADVSTVDIHGSSPAHLAAASGHLPVLQTLMQGTQPINMEQRNSKGISIRSLLLRALGEPQPIGGPDMSPRGLGHGARGTKSDQSQDLSENQADSEGESDDAAWRRRLREEASEDEYDGGGIAEEEGGAQHMSGAFPGFDETAENDDAWADRMWQEMQARRRAAAKASSRLFAASAKEMYAAQQAQQEAAHKEHMERLKTAQETLRQAQEQDAQWRRRALQGPPPPTALPALDPAQAMADYQQRWAALEQRLAASSTGAAIHLKLHDIGWPLPEGYPYDKHVLQEMMLYNVKGPSDIRQRLRSELMRWHPDKFSARFGTMLASKDKDAILARVKEVSQSLTAMMTA